MGPTNRALADEALAIIEAAGEAGLTVRLAGSAAFVVHCPSAERINERMGRRIVDVDLVTMGKTKAGAIEALLGKRGYAPLAHHNIWHAETRQMFERPDGVHVDVFRDELNFCHPISLKNRLEADYPTIPLPELLLQKLQIVEINEKDLHDAAVLLLDHASGGGKDELDAGFVAATLAADWGFWYTATTNLGRLRASAPVAFDGAERRRIEERLDALEARIEREPKSSRWKLRARVGPRKRWYQEVEETHR